MAKIKVYVTHSATMEIGDLPWSVVSDALKADDGEFNIWEYGSDVTIESVELTSGQVG